MLEGTNVPIVRTKVPALFLYVLPRPGREYLPFVRIVLICPYKNLPGKEAGGRTSGGRPKERGEFNKSYTFNT